MPHSPARLSSGAAHRRNGAPASADTRNGGHRSSRRPRSVARPSTPSRARCIMIRRLRDVAAPALAPASVMRSSRRSRRERETAGGYFLRRPSPASPPKTSFPPVPGIPHPTARATAWRMPGRAWCLRWAWTSSANSSRSVSIPGPLERPAWSPAVSCRGIRRRPSRPRGGCLSLRVCQWRTTQSLMTPCHNGARNRTARAASRTIKTSGGASTAIDHRGPICGQRSRRASATPLVLTFAHQRDDDLARAGVRDRTLHRTMG